MIHVTGYIQQHPVPKIIEILLKTEHFKYSTSLNFNIGYYHIRISKDAINLCMIILPCGKDCYKHLLMGFSNSTDILQQTINDLYPRVLIYMYVYI